MGLFDDFIDGDKVVQLKNFNPFQNTYEKGADLRKLIEELILPMTASYFCIADDLNKLKIVHIKDGIFIGIDDNVSFPLFDCQGKYYDESTFKQLQERKKKW